VMTQAISANRVLAQCTQPAGENAPFLFSLFTAEFAANNDFKGTPAFTFNVNAIWTEYFIDPDGEMQDLN
jgi:hypothetical protein